MGKNVDGAAGCSANAGALLTPFVSKYEATKLRQAEESRKKKEQAAGQKDSGAPGNVDSNGNATGISNGTTSSAKSNPDDKITDDKESTTCTVTYMSGKTVYAKQTVEKGKTVLYNDGEMPDKPGDERAKFCGWFFEEKVGEKKTEFTGSDWVKEDIVVYAKWIREICHSIDGKLFDRREVEIEAPECKAVVEYKLSAEANGDVTDWHTEQGV